MRAGTTAARRVWVPALVVITGILTAPVVAEQQRETASVGRTRIVMLGTGNPAADPDRSGPATAIVVNDTAYLVDFGPGVIRRAKAAVIERGVTALEPTNLRVAFVTHLHSDHTVGYADLIFSPWTLGRRVPIDVYGPTGIKAMTAHLLEAYRVGHRDAHQRRRQPARLPGRLQGECARDPRGRRVQGRERECHGLPDQARHGKLRVSLRYRRSQHRDLGRYEPRAGHDRRVPGLRRADPRGEHARVAVEAGLEVPGLRGQVPHVHRTARRTRGQGEPRLLVLCHHSIALRPGVAASASTPDELLREMSARYSGQFVIGRDLDVY